MNVCTAQELFLTSEAASSEAKNRKYIILNGDVVSNGNSYTPYYGLMYGLSGNLTLMCKEYYSRNSSQSFFGDIDLGTNYRFYSDDRRQFHYRMSLITHIKIPVEAKQIYNPSNTSSKDFANNFANQVIASQYKTDNWNPYAGIAVTLLEKRFAANFQFNYAFTIPKGDYKYGNYSMGGLAFGYLIFPKQYKGYGDMNVNLYVEPKVYYFEENKIEQIGKLTGTGGWEEQFTAGVQLIIASTSLIELGYTYTTTNAEFETERNLLFLNLKYLFF